MAERSVAAAASAGGTARRGARVTLADDGVVPGGALRDTRLHIADEDAREWVARTVAELDSHGNVTRVQDATVAGYYDHDLLTVVERAPGVDWVHERLWKVRARRVILASVFFVLGFSMDAPPI